MLRVNEVYGPVKQGEGHSIGKEVLFLRLSGCNLHCIWCDTPYTWNWTGTTFLHPDKFEQKKEEHVRQVLDVFVQLVSLSSNMSHKAVVVSGGEPMIQQKELIELFRLLKKDNWWIEVETNGTVKPMSEIMDLVSQFNCSPKLSNSLDPLSLREKPQALNILASLATCYFKFVITSEQDIREVQSLITRYDMARDRIYLMPEGRIREDLDKTRLLTKQMAKILAINFSDRLHIVEHGNVRGV